MYKIDEELYNKTGQVAFLKYSPLGDYVDYFSSGSKTFNNIINGIEDGTFTTSNPLDSRDSELTKSVERNIGEMSEDELKRYLEGVENAFKENDLASEYDDKYNGTLFSNMDYKDVAWMLPSTGAYYIKTDKGFDAYNAQGCLIGSITDSSKVAAIYMEIETGILERGTPIINNTKQNKTSGGSTIASAKTLQAPTSTLSASPSAELNSLMNAEKTQDITDNYNSVQDSVIIKDDVKESNENYTEEYLQKDINGDGEVGNSTKSNSSNNSNSSSTSSSDKGFQGLASAPFGSNGGKGDIVNGHNYLSQYDSRWRNSTYEQTSGKVDSNDAEMTVGARGCGPTALAMVANQVNGTDLTPTDLTRVAEDYGYSDETGTNWSFMNDVPNIYGLDSKGVQNPTEEFVDRSLAINRPVILSGSSNDSSTPYTSAGHYVVAVGKKNGNYLINDPRGKRYSHEYTPESVLNNNRNTAAWSIGSLRDRFKNGGKGLISRAKSILNNRKLIHGSKGSTDTNNGNDKAINSPYRGKFRMSQQFIGDKFDTQVRKDGYEHDGYDLVGIDDKTLYATVPGVVVKAGWESEADHNKGFGQYVKIQKNGNEDEFYYYGHMSEILVKQGDVVDYGTPIGIEGTTGRSTGPHCHYCIRSANTGYLDITTISNIPNVIDTYEDNGDYISTNTTSTSTSSNDSVTTSNEQSIFEKLTTGLTNLVGRTINGLATGEWNNDWSNILGQSQTISVLNQNSSGTSAVDLQNGDYIGKYVKQFESGSDGPAMVSNGESWGDPGGTSFGTYQFPSYGKSIADKDTSLYQFWNKYYASTNSDVTPGRNTAFIERWKQLASSDPDGFFANEYQFCYDQYYKKGLNQSKVVGSVNPDIHRSTQESFWSTMVQFGPSTNCLAEVE